MTDLVQQPDDDQIIPPTPSAPEEAILAHSGYIAVVGRPNVGKSTLMNRILGEKLAIVSPKPQTTRLTQLGILTEPGLQAIFVDTPGIHQPRHKLGEFMVDVAVEALRDADVILFVVDNSEPPTEEDRRVAAIIRDSRSGAPVIVAINKLDVCRPEYVQVNVDAYMALVPDAEWEAISARLGDGIDALLRRVVNALPSGPQFFPEDQLSDRAMRDIAAETIREKVMHNTEKEVPHSIAVEVEEYKERSASMTYIRATIYVERDSQKAIVIGKQGAMIKRISSESRNEIEQLVGTQVYLELAVRVEKDWRSDDTFLRRLGYRIRE